jgi:hypothetical protein
MYPALYVKSQHKLRLEKGGNMKIIRGNDPSYRRPTYDAGISDSLAFPHLYPYGEKSPMDFESHVLNRYLLKKQTQFAQKTENYKLRCTHAEDGVHMMHQYARLMELEISATVGWYLSQRPDILNMTRIFWKLSNEAPLRKASSKLNCPTFRA